MAAMDFDLKFTYVLAGWEGSAHNALILANALERNDGFTVESLSLVLVINDTKLLMPCVKCFELGISNTCDEGVCGKKCGHKIKEMVHGHEMMIMVEMHIK
jgi:hypothetical protein